MEGADARPSSIPKSPGGKSSRASFPAIADRSVEDITAEILGEAALPEIPMTSADLQASHFDHVRDLRKHEPV
jgi:hypothetical protein